MTVLAAVAARRVIAGDVAGEAKAGAWTRSGSPSSVTLWVISGSDHSGGLDTDPRGWEERVTAFLTSAPHAGGAS